MEWGRSVAAGHTVPRSGCGPGTRVEPCQGLAMGRSPRGGEGCGKQGLGRPGKLVSESAEGRGVRGSARPRAGGEGRHGRAERGAARQGPDAARGLRQGRGCARAWTSERAPRQPAGSRPPLPGHAGSLPAGAHSRSPARGPQRRPSSSIPQPGPQPRAPPGRAQGRRHHRRRLRASREPMPRRAGGAEAQARSRGGRRPLRPLRRAPGPAPRPPSRPRRLPGLPPRRGRRSPSCAAREPALPGGVTADRGRGRAGPGRGVHGAAPAGISVSEGWRRPAAHHRPRARARRPPGSLGCS